MHILSVHNYYQVRGGEDVSSEAEENMLREMNHTVGVYKKHNDEIKNLSGFKISQKTIWSRQSYREIQQYITTHHPDLIHVQNFFPIISPSIYYAAQSLKIPIVQTLRNYRLLCPNGLFFRAGRVCEDCLHKPIPYPGIIHACYRESRLATTVTASMLVAHRALKTWSKQVSIYITLTEFARQKFIEGGFPPDKIVTKPNFVHPDPGVGSGAGGYALFVGRLSVEKGLDTLLTAWQQLQTPIPLKIVGDGPLAEQVKAIAATNPAVEWLGRKAMPEVHHLMGEARFLVFPSQWYETFGRVAVEAFAKGTPVIAAKIGAIAELVTHNHTGFHFQPGDPQDLARVVQSVLQQPDKLAAMRHTVRHEYETKYTAPQNYARLMDIYHQVLAAAPAIR
ncbi:glycosyltransferase [Spirulina major]|uniref:glycosyltransferase n=1 Tax=Spirulina major TaxID=270636 RepID=UPI000934C5F1|nr:glycosyltransferase [Spirulina major]